MDSDAVSIPRVTSFSKTSLVRSGITRMCSYKMPQAALAGRACRYQRDFLLLKEHTVCRVELILRIHYNKYKLRQVFIDMPRSSKPRPTRCAASPYDDLPASAEGDTEVIPQSFVALALLPVDAS